MLLLVFHCSLIELLHQRLKQNIKQYAIIQCKYGININVLVLVFTQISLYITAAVIAIDRMFNYVWLNRHFLSVIDLSRKWTVHLVRLIIWSFGRYTDGRHGRRCIYGSFLVKAGDIETTSAKQNDIHTFESRDTNDSEYIMLIILDKSHILEKITMWMQN